MDRKISVIVCSKSAELLTDLKKNVNETIGCFHEIISIDNSKNNYSITQAYNQGIINSKGDILCFLHEDIYIHTNNWGEILINLFENDKSLGLVGIAGSKIKTNSPSGWWNCPQNYRSANLIQHLPNGKKEFWNYGFEKNEEEVVAVDGVFMALTRNNTITFNEKLRGFHNYDLSISIDYINAGYKLNVTNQILIEHFSIGSVDQEWYKEALKFKKIYNNFLPLRTENISNEILEELEYSNRYNFIKGLIVYNLISSAFLQWFHLIFIKPISRKNLKILKLLFK